jgi:hypothetical protein
MTEYKGWLDLMGGIRFMVSLAVFGGIWSAVAGVEHTMIFLIVFCVGSLYGMIKTAKFFHEPTNLGRLTERIKSKEVTE